MIEKHNPNRESHRFRTRGTSSESPNWEVLQAVVGFAFTIQQEIQKLRRDTSAVRNTLAQRQEASVQEGFPSALGRIAAAALNLTEGSAAALAIGDERGMTCVARRGASAPPLGSRFDERSGLVGECIRTRESVICMNSAADPRVDYNACVALGIRSMIYHPLIGGNKLIGVLAVFSANPQHFSHRDVNCLGWTDELVSEALLTSNLQLGVGALLREAGVPEPEATPARESAEVPSTAAEAGVKAFPAAKSPPAVGDVAVVPSPSLPKAEPTFVGRIVDEGVAGDEFELTFGQKKPEEYDSPVPMLIAAILVLAFVVVAGLMSYLRLGPKSSPPAPPAQQTSTFSPPPAAPVLAPPNNVSSSQTASPEPARGTEGESQLTRDFPPGMRFTSERGGAVLALSYSKRATYQGFAITNPNRLYFDIQGVKLVGPKGAMIDVNNDLVSRIRISLHTDNITRIVFDLRKAVDFQATPTTDPLGLRIALRPKAPGAAESVSEENVTIVIDPGHGGRDNGAVSADGMREKDLTLDIARRLGALLQQRLGAHVVYTRTTDEYLSLATRASIANHAHADFLISIHGNSSSYHSVRGVETYYFPNPQDALVRASDALHPVTQQDDVADARSFAADVHQALLHGLNDDNQTTLNRGLKTAPFIVLKDAHMPAVLAEVAFMSSRKDAQRLASAAYREKVAKALYQGIYNHVTRRDARVLSASDSHTSTAVASR